MDIRPEFLREQDAAIAASDKYRVVQSTLSKVPIDSMMNDPNAINKLQFKFNHALKEKVVPGNQYQSGRCWIFAALGVLRHKLIQAHKLPETFELSQAFIYKYDKLEKCNTALEIVYDYARRGQLNTLEFTSLSSSILSDGGTMDMFLNVVNKYGVVPKDVFPDNAQAKHTGIMNDLLFSVLHKTIADIDGMSLAAFRKYKAGVMQECYRIITLCIGNTPTTFEWSLHDTSATKSYTPQSFYATVVKPVIDLKDYVTIANDPRHMYGTLLAVEFLHNVLSSSDNNEAELSQSLYQSKKKTVFGDCCLRRKMTNAYLNVDMATFKRAAFKTIDTYACPVWFATDYTNFVMNDSTILDQESSVTEDIFDISIIKDKKTSMRTRITQPNHAMILTGVHAERTTAERTKSTERTTAERTKPNKNMKYVRWKVENSHGTKQANSPVLRTGFLTMSDAYFDDFMIVGFVHKNTLPPNLRALYKNRHSVSTTKTWLPFWDILGVYAC